MEHADTEQNPEPHSHTKQELKREAIELFKLVAWFLVLFLVMRTYVVEGYEVQGESMEPTLHDQERILVLKLPHVLSQWGLTGPYEPVTPGAIVVFDCPPEEGRGKRFVKRVIAKGEERARNVADAEGQTSQADAGVRVLLEDGAVYVDNQRVDEPYLDVPIDDHDGKQETVLHAGQYYVLGDNRDVSKDSRRFGPITGEEIIGKAVFRIWPLSKVGFLQ